MKLFLFCTFIAVLGLARGVDVKCIYYDSVCRITEPITVKTGERVNITSDDSLDFIENLIFVAKKGNRSQISTVPSEIFEQLPNLETLELHATVKELNKGDFEKASKLKQLTIGNQLKTVPAGVLTSAINLEGLFLSKNQITKIEDNAFSGLNELIYFHLERNKLTIIKQNTFSGLVKLEILYLQSNQIELIEENALNLPNLEELDLSDNKLTSLPDHLFTAIPLLCHFRAKRNQINHIGNALYGLKHLKHLFLNENELAGVHLVAFSQLPTLVNLGLEAVGLTSDIINKTEVREPSKSVLSYLWLANNELTNNNDWKKFSIFPQLRIIDVQNTKYSKIDLGNKTLRQQFSKLERVYVSSSEWNCDWLKNFIKNSKEEKIHVRTTSFSNANGKNVNGIGCV